jgi:hypothetical protein
MGALKYGLKIGVITAVVVAITMAIANYGRSEPSFSYFHAVMAGVIAALIGAGGYTTGVKSVTSSPTKNSDPTT